VRNLIFSQLTFLRFLNLFRSSPPYQVPAGREREGTGVGQEDCEHYLDFSQPAEMALKNPGISHPGLEPGSPKPFLAINF